MLPFVLFLCSKVHNYKVGNFEDIVEKQVLSCSLMNTIAI